MTTHERNLLLTLSLLFVGCDDVDGLAGGGSEIEATPDDPSEPTSAGPPVGPTVVAGQPRLVGSYEEFLAHHTERASDGSWVVEGDLWMADERAVRAYYDESILGVAPPTCEGTGRCPRSNVMQTDGRDSVWSAHGKLALTYCIGDMGSASNFNRVTAAVRDAARDWESSADINFIHLSAQDGEACAPNSNGALFRVRRKTSGCSENLLARAFFPHTSAADRELEYCDLGLAQSDAELLTTTKHELGHILGLRHEHYRWAQDEGGCQGSTTGRNLTSADSLSIMGYNFCNGMDEDNTVLSPRDRVGVHRLYNISKGHGRLSGSAFHQANSFRGTGASDDIFWFTPNGDSYSLWAGPSVSGSGPISFTKTTHDSLTTELHWRPLAVQWINNGDANYDREILFFGPGSIADRLYTNDGDGSFTGSSLVINTQRIPLIGRFHGGTYSEILWWNTDGESVLWRTDGAYNITQTAATTAYDGGTHDLDFSYKPLIGSFGAGAASASEILWYGDCYAWVTRGTGSAGFETEIVELYNATGTCDMVRHIPLLGDFDGDSKGDIFWYGPGDREDRLMRLHGSLYEDLITGTFNVYDLPVNGHYKPLVGDFNGDYRSDIFWYQPGTGADPIWLFTGSGQYDDLVADVDGDYAPIVGDFNNDGCDDIVWFDAPGDEAKIWRSDCDGTFTAQTPQAVPDRAYPVGYGMGF